MGKGRTNPNYQNKELLKIIHEILPTSLEEWKIVARRYRDKTNEAISRDPKHVCRHFNEKMCLYGKPPSTAGKPERQEFTTRAQEIRLHIEAKSKGDIQQTENNTTAITSQDERVGSTQEEKDSSDDSSQEEDSSDDSSKEEEDISDDEDIDETDEKTWMLLLMLMQHNQFMQLSQTMMMLNMMGTSNRMNHLRNFMKTQAQLMMAQQNHFTTYIKDILPVNSRSEYSAIMEIVNHNVTNFPVQGSRKRKRARGEEPSSPISNLTDNV